MIVGISIARNLMGLVLDVTIEGCRDEVFGETQDENSIYG